MGKLEAAFDTGKYSFGDVIGDGMLFKEYSRFIRKTYHDRAVLEDPRLLLATDTQAVQRDFYVPDVSPTAQDLFAVLTSEERFQAYQEDRRMYNLFAGVLEDVNRIFIDQPKAKILRQLTDTQLRQIQHERSLVAFAAKQELARYIVAVNDTEAQTFRGDICEVYWCYFGNERDVYSATDPQFSVENLKGKHAKLAFELNERPYGIHLTTPYHPLV